MAKFSVSLPRLPRLSLAAAVPQRPKRKKKKRLPVGAEKRRIKRITLKELNVEGAELLRTKLPEIKKLKDRRPGYMKVLDVLDLPRNVVANAIGSLVGLDKPKAERAALGLKRIYTSDILKKLGVKNKVVRGIAGFIGDVAIDPLTYATLGATTGLSLGKHAPRMLKPLVQMLRQGARTGRISEQVAKGLGTTVSRFAKIQARLVRKRGAMQAAKRLMGKRGGVMSRTLAQNVLPGKSMNATALRKLEGARKLLSQYGERGRTLFRLPFAAKGLMLPVGKRAALWREFAGHVPQQVKEIGVAAARITGVAKLPVRALQVEKAVTAREAARVQRATQLIKEMKAKGFEVTGKAEAVIRRAVRGPAFRAERVRERLTKIRAIRERGLEAVQAARAKEVALRTAPEAPLSVRLAAEAAIGKPALADIPADATKAQRFIHAARRMKQQVFGPGSSAMRQQEVALAHQATMGRAVAAMRTNKRFSDIADPVAQRMAERLGGTADDAMARIYDLVETGGVQGLEGYHASDPIMQSVRATTAQLTRHTDLAADVNNVVAQSRQFLDELYQRMALANVSPGRIRDFIPRAATKEFRAASDPHIRRVFGEKAWTAPRVHMIEYLAEGSQETTQLLTTNIAKIKEWNALVSAGKARRIGKFDISARWWNTPQDRKWGQLLKPPEFSGAQFVTNIGEAMGSAASQAETRLAAAGVRNMARETGVRVSAQVLATDPAFRHFAVPVMNKESPLYHFALRQLEGMSFPKPVADMIERATAISVDLGEVGRIVRATDGYLNLWKGVTLMHPAYTIRNVMQNILGGAMQGAPPGRVIAASREIRPIVRAVLQGEPVTGTIMIQGRAISAQVFANDIRIWNMVNSGVMSQAMTPSLYQKTKSSILSLGRRWYRWNNEIESTMKAGIFKTFLDDGLTARQAAMKTILAMPDLTDLTRFERGVMRRVFPWYSWFRRNGALQLFHYLPNKPAFAAGAPKFRNALETAFTGGDVVARDLQPEWMQDLQAVQFTGDKEEGRVFLLASWLPFEEMIKVFVGPFDPQEAMRTVLEQMRPEIKFGAEMGIGVDIFRRQALPKFTLAEYVSRAPLALAGRSRTPLDNVLAVRPIREAFRVAEMPRGRAMVERAVLGGALQPISRARGLRAEAVRLREELAKARYGINRARQVNDMQLAQTLTIRWMQILRRMQQMGLPGVPKATGALLEQAGIAAGSGLRGSP